jgi:chorismate synthase
MPFNEFGTLFKITTWGESHGPFVGVVIDGCPAGLEISEDDINVALAKRAPGKSLFTSPRKEPDQAQIVSGMLDGKTTGAPLSILLPNLFQDSSPYKAIETLVRPGHANSTYIKKYGTFDSRGGGRASARETACRVAAGAVAKKLLEAQGIEVCSYIDSIGEVKSKLDPYNLSMGALIENVQKSPINCLDIEAEQEMIRELQRVIEEGDSLGGCVRTFAQVPCGLGEPIYMKIEALLARACLSIPASKGFEIGAGFEAAKMQGSQHNDEPISFGKTLDTKSNRSGGVLGGITSGMPLDFRVAFKPTSSIKKEQKTIDLNGNAQSFQIPKEGKHDPCVAIRAVPVVEAMTHLVLADLVLLNCTSRISELSSFASNLE